VEHVTPQNVNQNLTLMKNLSLGCLGFGVLDLGSGVRGFHLHELQDDAAHVSNTDTEADCSFWVTPTSNLRLSTKEVTGLPSLIPIIILQLRVRQRRTHRRSRKAQPVLCDGGAGREQANGLIEANRTRVGIAASLFDDTTT